MRMMAATLLFSLLAAPLAGGAAAGPDGRLPIHDGVGGAFSAASSLGREVSLSELRGKVVLLFFGYTSCQDVCPVTLAHLAALVKRLEPEVAADVQVLFATVDPETDTAERLRSYLARFDPRFIGLTGTRAEMDRILGLFAAHAHRSHDVQVSTEYHRSEAFTEHAYLYSHSQQIYLLDAGGRTRALYFSGTPLAEMEAGVRSLLKERVAAADGESSEQTEGDDR